MQLFRQGYYEYDKPAAKPTRQCADCPSIIEIRGGKKVCAPCYNVRLKTRALASNRKAYHAKKAALQCA